ncbi:MAG: hypothetical protein ACPG52_09380 [Cognaticolwellia sp.]
MKILSIPLFILLLVGTLKTQATEFINCTSCSSNYSYSKAAEKQALTNKDSLITEVISFNVVQNRIKAFDVYLELKSDGSAQATSIEKTVDAAVKQKFNILTKAYKTVVSELDIHKEVPASISPSAYRLVQTEYLQQKFESFFNTNQIFMDKFSNYIAAGTALTGAGVTVELIKTVYFIDESNVRMRLNGIGSNGELKLKLLSAKDAQNNNIPVT